MAKVDVTVPHLHWCPRCRQTVTHDPTFPYGRCPHCQSRFGAVRAPDPQLTENDRQALRRAGLAVAAALAVAVFISAAAKEPGFFIIAAALSLLGLAGTVWSLSAEGRRSLLGRRGCPCCNTVPGEIVIRHEVTARWVETRWRDEVTRSTSHAVTRPRGNPDSSQWSETDTTTEHVRRVPYEVAVERHVKDTACGLCGYATTRTWDATV